MENEQDKSVETAEAEIRPEETDAGSRPAETEPEENVVSVWYGSGNTKWFRKRRFDGYTQYETLEPNGKKVMHHVYTGYYYTQELDERGRWQHRIVYIGFAVFAAALILFASTRYIAANMHWPGGVPAFVSLFGIAWALYGVVNDFIVPQKRTIGDYRASSKSIIRGALVSAIASGVLMIVTLVYTVIGSERTGLHLLAAFAELVAGCLAAVVSWLETKVKYTESRSELAGKYTM